MPIRYFPYKRLITTSVDASRTSTSSLTSPNVSPASHTPSTPQTPGTSSNYRLERWTGEQAHVWANKHFTEQAPELVTPPRLTTRILVGWRTWIVSPLAAWMEGLVNKLADWLGEDEEGEEGLIVMWDGNTGASSV